MTEKERQDNIIRSMKNINKAALELSYKMREVADKFAERINSIKKGDDTT